MLFIKNESTKTLNYYLKYGNVDYILQKHYIFRIIQKNDKLKLFRNEMKETEKYKSHNKY